MSPCNPQVRAEAQAVFGTAEAEPTRRAVDGMTYTLSVLKEALRKYSVVPVVTRTLAKDDELLGHKVPAGTMVACMLQVSRSTHGIACMGSHACMGAFGITVFIGSHRAAWDWMTAWECMGMG